MPSYKRHSVPGQLQFLTSSAYRRARPYVNDGLPSSAELRSAPTCDGGNGLGEDTRITGL